MFLAHAPGKANLLNRLVLLVDVRIWVRARVLTRLPALGVRSI